MSQLLPLAVPQRLGNVFSKYPSVINAKEVHSLQGSVPEIRREDIYHVQLHFVYISNNVLDITVAIIA